LSGIGGRVGEWSLNSRIVPRIVQLFAVLVVVAFGASALHAAAISDQQTTSRTSGTEAISTEVKVGWLGDIANWNPMSIVMEEDYVACYLMFSALFTYDQDWNGPVGDLALSWYQVIQPDDTMITIINITENAYFRNKANPTDDTHHLTANDVKYTFDRIMANPGGTWDIYLLDITSVTVLNDWTIVITTAYPKATLIDDLSGIPIIPQYIWNSVSDRQFLTAKTPSWLVGSGPFYFDASATGAWYKFTRAPNYFGAVEYLGVRAVKAVESILYTVYADPSALTIAMNSGMEDCAVLTGSPNLYLNTLGVNSNVNVIKQAVNEPGFCDIAINAIPMLNRTSTYGKGNPLLLDPVVRQAIEMTLSRDTIVDTIMSGLPAMADSVIQPGFWHKTISSQLPFDPVAARALLMANGDYIDTDGDGYLEATATAYPVQQGWAAVGSELSFRLHASAFDPSYFVIAQNWVPWAAQAGIRFTASQLSETVMTNSDWYKANYDVWVWHWGEGPEPLSTLGIWLWDEMRPGGDNCQMPMGPTPGAYDAKYRQAQRTLDKTERKAMVDQLQQWVYDSYCEMPPYYYIGLYGLTDERWTGWGDWASHPARTVISSLPWLWFDLVPYNANKIPVFDTTLYSAYQVLVNTAHEFSVTVHDDDGDPLTVNWSFGDGGYAQSLVPGTISSYPTVVTATRLFTQLSDTGFAMTVSVWDGQLGHEITSSAVVYVTNIPPDTSPVFTSPVYYNPVPPVLPGMLTTWSVSAMDYESGSPGGFGLLFTWSWGDGTSTLNRHQPTTNYTAVTDTVTHSWAGDGSYSVVVSVWDGFGIQADPVHNVSSLPIHYLVSSIPPEEAAWTFLVYLDADNNLEDVGSVDFNEMASVGSNSDLNIVVQMDRTPYYDMGYGDWTDTKRFLVTPGMMPTPENAIADLGEMNMGDAATLQDFITWGIQNYPADNYALVLWDHGGGWDGAVCWDDTDYGDSLTLDEVKTAIANAESATGTKIDLLGYDACLMGMAEVVYETKDLVDVAVASEETIPWDGWPYNTVLSDLASNPMMTAQEFGSAIVTRYMEYYTYEGMETNSAIDVASTSWLYSSIDAFANALIASMPDYRSQIADARMYAQTFSYSTYMDLYSFAAQLTVRLPGGALFDAAVDVANALQSCLIAEGHGSYLPDAHGLSIYFPSDPSQYWSTYETTLDFTAALSWDEFLKEFLKVAPDAYEPDNSWTEARWIDSGETQTHSISDGGSDVDWVTFDVSNTMDIRLRTFNYYGSPGDTEMWLYDATGVIAMTPIAYNNDAGGSTWSTIRAQVGPGQYYAMVGSFGGLTEIASYDLSLETGYIPNEPPYAVLMFWPVPLVGIPTTFDGSFSFDPDGTIVDYFWDFGDGSVSHDAVVVDTFQAAGSYVVTLTVTDDGGASSMSGGVFDVQEPVAPDMYEDDDTYLDASTISLGETQQHSISDAGMDMDWVTFTLAEPTVVEIYTSGPQDQYSDTIIVLWDESGVPNTPIAWNDDDGQSLWSKIVISLEAGTYYALVTSYSLENEIREYYITLDVYVPVAPDSYEPDNDWTMASQIALGETQTHGISDLGYDVDWVTFALTEQTTVSIMTSGEPMTVTNTIIALFDGYGVPYQPLAMSDDFWENGTSLIQMTLGPGQYWVEVWSYDYLNEIPTYYLHLIEGIVHNEPPVAYFNYWPYNPAVGAPVTFDASYSWDPDGWIESYAWDFGDGTSSDGSYVSHTFWEAGDYLVTLTVTDNLGASSSTSTWIYVYENLPPVAYLYCSPTHASPGDTIYMSAYGSYDPDGGIWYLNWDFGDGNVWTGTYMWDVWYTYYQPGAYTVTVTVFDYYGASSSASVTIFINIPPVPVISSPALGKAGFPVTFDGSMSFDPDGFITSYFWDFGDGFTAEGPVVTHVYGTPGTYWVYLIVSDDMWAYGSTVMQFMVVQPVPPVAIAVYDVPRPLVGQIVLFDGSNSVDPDGFIVSYMWQFGDGSYAQGMAATHVYAHAGIYDVRLTVIDEDGLADDNVVSITVASVPIAGFTYSPLGARAGQTISFYASDSYDETGIVEYEWDFGDGSYATGWQVTHAYSAGGRYDVTLSVTNVYGITASTDQGVPVKVFMAYVKGTVVTPDLKPLKGATVQISQAGIIIGQAKTNGEDGHWTLVLKHPGTYDLTISKRGYQTLKMSITVSGGTLDLGKITLAANVGVISLSNVNPTPTGFPVMGMLVGMAVFGVATAAKRWRKSSGEDEENLLR